MNLPASGYDTNFPFSVDTLAIMAYHDGFTTTNDPSLVADLTFRQLDFFTPVPEPSTMMLVGLGVVAAVLSGRRSRASK